jgi:hypothetical protein
MTDLTDIHVGALKTLAVRRGGSLTPFLNIAAARHLTDLGLAARSQQGWQITPAGSAHLARLGPPPLAVAPDHAAISAAVGSP